MGIGQAGRTDTKSITERGTLHGTHAAYWEDNLSNRFEIMNMPSLCSFNNVSSVFKERKKERKKEGKKERKTKEKKISKEKKKKRKKEGKQK